MECEKYLWGKEFVSKDEINIDLHDRGYTFGDGIYEVIHAYNGKLFGKKEHLDRLERSADLIELNLKCTREELDQLCDDFVEVNNITDGYIYVQVTRGDKITRNHKSPFYDDQVPVFSGFAVDGKRNKESIYAPSTAVTYDDLRGELCHVKSLNLLPNILAAHHAQKKNARKAILIRDNVVTEEKSGNVLIVKNDTIYTHPDGPHILPGITKMTIKRACEDNGISYVERTFTKEELFDADEVIVVDTGTETAAIVEIDGKKICDGNRGPWAEKIQDLYEKEIEKECGSLN